VIQHIDVHAVLRRSVSGSYTDLVTRPTGRAVREGIEQAIVAEASIAYSCADEIVAKLLRERLRVLLLSGLTDGHREAIEPVLAGHGLAVLLERPDGTLEPLGPRESADALLEDMIARRLATRTPGGDLHLTAV